MVYLLPDNFKLLFIPDEPLQFIPPIEKKWFPNFSGVSSYLDYFDDEERGGNEQMKILKETNEMQEEENGNDQEEMAVEVKEEEMEMKVNEILDKEEEKMFLPLWTKSGLRQKRMLRRKEMKEISIEQQLMEWNPNERSIESITDNPNRTIIVLRFPKNITEMDLRRKFENYGKITKVFIVKNKITQKSMGYAFIEYEHRQNALDAQKMMNGTMIGNKMIIVEMEKGRVDEHFIPTRFGGNEERKREEERKRQRELEREREREKDREKIRGRERQNERRDYGDYHQREYREKRDFRDNRDNRGSRDFRESRDTWERKENREYRDRYRDNRERDFRENRDNREYRNFRENRDNRDNREYRERDRDLKERDFEKERERERRNYREYENDRYVERGYQRFDRREERRDERREYRHDRDDRHNERRERRYSRYDKDD